jgi:CBS domain containing-hemolysin-like protein
VDSLLPVTIIAALILLNAVFVAAEFAIVGAPRLAIEQRARQGERVAQLTGAILDNPQRQDRFIATAQLGITFASLGLGMYGEHMVAGWIFEALAHWGTAGWLASHAFASTLAVGLLTYLHIVLGEMIPKSLALQRAEQTALWITPLMLTIQAVMYPLVVTLNGMGNAALRLVGVHRHVAAHERYYSAEELQLVVEESRRAGLLAAESGRLIREIFEFADSVASDAMVPRVSVVGIRVGATPAEVQEILRRAPHARYPVYERDMDHVVGVIHARELLQIFVAGETIGAHHTRPLPVVPETAPLDSVLATMQRERTHMVLVIDEHGGVEGVIALEDLVEEVIGEVDGGAHAGHTLRRAADGTWSVGGMVRLDELGEHLGVELDHEEVYSVSGLVLMTLGRPPAVGDVVVYRGFSFTVTTVQGLGVCECTVVPTQPHRGSDEDGAFERRTL